MSIDPPISRPFAWEDSLTATWRSATGDGGIGNWSLADTFVRCEEAEARASFASKTEYDWLEIWIEEITVPPAVVVVLHRTSDGLFDVLCNGIKEVRGRLIYADVRQSLEEDSFFKVAGPIRVTDGWLDRCAALR